MAVISTTTMRRFIRSTPRRRFKPHHWLALVAAISASAVTSLAMAFGAFATNQGYNCETDDFGPTCVEANAYPQNYITNDYGIDYTREGVCALTIKKTEKIWAEKCSSGYETLVCNGNEYEIYGEGATVASAGNKDTLAGKENNFQYCGD